MHWVSGGAGAPAAGEIHVQRFTTDAPAAPQAYQRMVLLLDALSSIFAPLLGPKQGTGQGGVSVEGAAVPAGHAGPSQGGEEGRGLGAPARGGPAMPVPPLGADDVVPAGMRPPGTGPGLSGIPGLLAAPPHRGSQVGPHDPMFGPGRLGSGVGLGGQPGVGGEGVSSLPPGARYDPIAPPGMRGFHPDDYVKDPTKIHPDIMQPGPGRGTDWDNMFG